MSEAAGAWAASSGWVGVAEWVGGWVALNPQHRSPKR